MVVGIHYLGFAASEELAAVYDGVISVLLAIVNHRAAVSRSCQASTSGCLRWLLLALPEQQLPSISAR